MRKLSICITLVTALVALYAPYAKAARETQLKGSAEQTFDVEAATQAYIAKMDPSKRVRADAYYEGGYWFQLFNFLLWAGISALLLFGKWSVKMRTLAERISKRKPVQTFLYWIQYLLVTSVISFPMTVYEGFFREHSYGFSTQSFGAWMGDQGKGLFLALLLGGLLFVVLYAVIRKMQKTWWIWGSVVMIAFIGITMFIGPVFIAPMFNKYERLKDPRLRDPIVNLATANGVEAEDVWIFDASKQHNRVSANVSGFLGTQRISLNDNLINRCTIPQIESVMAHEIGHYVLNHILKAVMFFFILIVAGFALIKWSFDQILNRFGARFGGIDGPGDVAGMPLFFFLFTTFFFLITPATNSFTRMQEREADLFALNASGVPDAQAEIELMVGEYRKTDPGPIEEIIFFHHPSTVSRVRMAMQWKSANLEE